MVGTFSSESLGIFECYDVWTHQSWASGSGESEVPPQTSDRDDGEEDNRNPENVM